MTSKILCASKKFFFKNNNFQLCSVCRTEIFCCKEYLTSESLRNLLGEQKNAPNFSVTKIKDSQKNLAHGQKFL